ASRNCTARIRAGPGECALRTDSTPGSRISLCPALRLGGNPEPAHRPDWHAPRGRQIDTRGTPPTENRDAPPDTTAHLPAVPPRPPSIGPPRGLGLGGVDARPAVEQLSRRENEEPGENRCAGQQFRHGTAVVAAIVAPHALMPQP